MKYSRLLKFTILILSTISLFASFQCQYLTTADNVKIRAGYFCGKGSVPHSTKAIIILPGMVSCMERQEFLAEQLAASGFDVWTLDFRGQGKSQRMVENKEMVHVDDFDQYITDAETLMNLKELKGKKLSLYGHSMGGQVALQLLKKHPTTFESTVLESPMIKLNTSPIPFILAKPIAYFFKTWLSRNKNFCIGRGNYDVKKESFEHNSNCRDINLFYKHRYIAESEKELIPTGPSWGWVYSALNATQSLLKDLASLKGITSKIFLATAGDDRRVNNEHDIRVASAFLNVAHRTYKNAWHCLLHDTLETRKSYVSDLTLFLKNPDAFIKDMHSKELLKESNEFPQGV